MGNSDAKDVFKFLKLGDLILYANRHYRENSESIEREEGDGYQTYRTIIGEINERERSNLEKLQKLEEKLMELSRDLERDSARLRQPRDL